MMREEAGSRLSPEIDHVIPSWRNFTAAGGANLLCGSDFVYREMRAGRNRFVLVRIISVWLGDMPARRADDKAAAASGSTRPL